MNDVEKSLLWANRNCPLCGHRLVKSPADSFPILYCETEIIVPGKFNSQRIKNHYLEDWTNKEITQYVMPYRIVTSLYQGIDNQSKVSILSYYSSGRSYFKTIAKCAPLHNDTEENLRKRLKTIMVFL